MLVIARKVGEALRIGRHITVIVHQIQGKRVQLSVSAPSSIRITRAELVAEGLLEETDDRDWESEGELPGEPDGNQPEL